MDELVAIVLAGGRSDRMGTDKTLLVLQGQTLLERAVLACGTAQRIVVAGPQSPLTLPDESEAPSRVEFVLEDPPFGGPVAGLAAAIEALTAEPDSARVLLVACDLPGVEAAVQLLLDATWAADGAVLLDDDGWPQFLAGCYRLGSLRRRLDEVGESRDLSMWRFARPLDLTKVPAGIEVTTDVDTPAQAEAWGIEVHHPRRRPEDDAENLVIVETWSAEIAAALAHELAVKAPTVEVDEVLKLASVVAKRVARPGVPVTGYLVGVAVGQAIASGQDPQLAAARALGLVTGLAAERPPRR